MCSRFHRETELPPRSFPIPCRSESPESGAGSCGNWVWTLNDLGLNGCQATVDCRSETVSADIYYTVESDGRCDIGGIVAERVVLVRARP